MGFVTGVIFGVQALWNWLIPELFNGPALTFWQTAGLFLLSKILLTGIAPGGHDKRKQDWNKKYREKYYCQKKEDISTVQAENV